MEEKFQIFGEQFDK